MRCCMEASHGTALLVCEQDELVNMMIVVRTRQIHDQVLCALAMAAIGKLFIECNTMCMCGIY
jgi:hypothetical protein